MTDWSYGENIKAVQADQPHSILIQNRDSDHYSPWPRRLDVRSHLRSIFARCYYDLSNCWSKPTNICRPTAAFHCWIECLSAIGMWIDVVVIQKHTCVLWISLRTEHIKWALAIFVPKLMLVRMISMTSGVIFSSAGMSIYLMHCKSKWMIRMAKQYKIEKCWKYLR